MQQPSNPPPVTRSAGLFVPLAWWLSIQVLVLLGAAMQLPLSDQFPRPAEQWALDELIVVQIALSAMLFPILLHNLPSTLAVAATSWPLLQLAGFLAAAPPMRLVWAGCFVSLWLLTLGLWGALLKHRKSQLIGVAVAVAVALAGPIGGYLNAEFGPLEAEVAAGSIDGRLGPILGALTITHDETGSGLAWLSLGCISITSVVLAGLIWRHSRRRAGGLVGGSGRP